MKSDNRVNLVLSILVIFSLGTSLFLSSGIVIQELDNTMQTEYFDNLFNISDITIDGNLTDVEWGEAIQVLPWWMDADDGNGNPDGYNYLYLDEDVYNLYLGLDLCSDQTGDVTDEWLGVWLNTNWTSVSNNDEWASKLNSGLESLIYDVENDQEVPFIDPNGVTEFEFDYIDSISVLNVINGTMSGNDDSLYSADDDYMNMTSEYNGTHYITRFDYELDFASIFSSYGEILKDYVYRASVNCWSLNNVSVDEHFLSVSDEEGKINEEIKLGLVTGTSEQNRLVSIWKENFTTPTKLIYSFNAINDAPFEASYDAATFQWDHNRTNIIGAGTIKYPDTSVNEYDIEWTFGPSVNNASDHRQFEISIPKAELEGYEMDTDLGIIVGGYGTLISWPNTDNWVLANDTLTSDSVTGIPEEDSLQYINLTMSMKGLTLLDDPILEDITPDPDPDGNVWLDWNDDAGAENWTLYRHSSEITLQNYDSTTIVASGLTSSYYNDTGLTNGSYWYAVAAIDSYGYTYLSNSMNVNVEIPWIRPDIPILEDISPDPDPDGNVWLDWNDDEGVENWTLYRHSSEITSSNLDDATEVASGLTESQYNDTGLTNGTYWYAVIAFDVTNQSYLSNSVSVSVEIPAQVTTTTTTDSSTTSTTTASDTGSSGTPPPTDEDGLITMILVVTGVGAAGVVVVVLIIVIRKR